MSDSMQFAKNFGREISRRRVAVGMTQGLLAQMAGRHRNTLIRWERGDGVPNVWEWHLVDSVLREREGRT